MVEDWRDWMDNAREQSELDEREMFDLWRVACEVVGIRSNNFSGMLEQIFRSKRSQQPAIEDETSDDDDAVIASHHSREYLVDRNTEEDRDYDVVDERGRNTDQ